MRLSMALIVRNEEQVLGRCLDSLSGAVDEIVVIDTGSTDATRALAARYTTAVYDFPWVHDFAAARQFAFERAKGDWVGWVDADDVVHGAERIRRLATEAPAHIGVLYWPYVVAWDAYGNPTCRFWRERMVRNDGSYRWQGRVHEVLTTTRPWGSQQCADVVIEHHPPPRDEDHGRRNLQILEQEVAGYVDDPPARLLFYLARELAGSGEPERALVMFQKCLRHSTWADERYQVLLQMAGLHQVLKDSEAAIDSLLQALKLCPHWPDAYFNLAQVYYHRQDWHKVVHWTAVGRAMPWPETQLFTNPMDYRFNWMIYYTNALFHMGELAEALAWTRRALAICPGDSWHRANLAFFSAGSAGELDDG